MKRPLKESSPRYVIGALARDRLTYPRPFWRRKGFWIIAAYRVNRMWRLSGWPMRLVFLPVLLALKFIAGRMGDAEIPSSVIIGPGFYLPHPSGVVVAPGSRIGPDVAIYQQVTLGNWDGGQPHIHAHAIVWAGAKLFGGIKVGRRAFVGANAALGKSVPAWHVAGGVPATSRLRDDPPARAALGLGEKKPTNPTPPSNA